MRDGVVWRRTEFRTGDDAVDLATVWKIWVPVELREQLIADSHEPSTSAHGGMEKTVDLLRRSFFWPGLAKEVREFIKRCETCKTTKALNQTSRPPMGKRFPVVRPFQRLYIDLLGPYPRSKAGNTTILIVLDQVSKFVWLHPLRRATARHIVDYVEQQCFHVFGVPESIISDNGVQFVAKEFTETLKRYGVQHILTSSHSPQANASERVNRSILAAVRSYIKDDQTTWDVELSSIASALRNSVHQSTGHSPHYIVFGQHMIKHGSEYQTLRAAQLLPDGGCQTITAADFRDVLMETVHKQ